MSSEAKKPLRLVDVMAQKQEQTKTEASPVENAASADVITQNRNDANTGLRTNANDEILNNAFTFLRKNVNAEKRKKPVRKCRVNAIIQQKHWDKLEAYAYRHKLYLSEAIEQAIDLLVLRKNANTQGALIEHDDDLDDDSKELNHHHAPVEIRHLYHTLTGNEWQGRDDRDYATLGLPVEQVSQRMREIAANARAAGTQIQSFGYFKKSLLSQGVGERAALIEQYRGILREHRETLQGYPPSRKEEWLFAYCERHRIKWDKLAYNEA